ncbi:MAG: hypothetical protein GEU98_09830 [Pseudonocardiaceae bacterium]|nr:hypothetical protein [Pseudonocardiaceae bacterium]
MSYRVRSTIGLALIVGTMLGGAAVAQADAEPRQFTCDRGEFCVWAEDSYRGWVERMDLSMANPEKCVPLPDGLDARSFTNRTDRAVTVYQDRNCSPEADFSTYPGGGTYVPEAPFVVRAIQLWN